MKGFSRPLLVCVALGGFLDGANANTLITAKDRMIASKATTQKGSLCMGLTPLELPDDPKGKLHTASGDNFALEAMRGAKDSKEFETKLNDKMDAGFVMSKAGPILACLLFFIAYLMCCWTSCPFCKCCRIKKGEHSPKRVLKFVIFIVIALVLLGMLIAGIMSQRGFNRASEGFKHTSCTGATLLDTTLNGYEDPHFLGMIPALNLLDTLVSTLDPSSQFITDLTKLIDGTKDIENAVYITRETLALLRSTVALPANAKPSNANGDLLHECRLCTELTNALTPAIKALDDGMASKLNAARAEVKKQLSGTALTDLQATVRTATTPLADVKKMFVDNFGWMVDSTTLQDVTGHMDRAGLGFCLVLVLCALLISCCASTTLTFWTCREKYGAEPNHQYRATVHRLACCTWCSGCCYMFLAFLVGGIMTLFSVPMASMCLIMDDVSGQMLDDISGALSMNISGDSGVMMKDMIDQCFRNPDKSANPYLLDIIFTRNKTSNVKESLRKTIVNNTKDMIDKQFAAITESMGTGGGAQTMADDPNIKKLTKTLRDTKVSSLMLIPKSKVEQIATLGSNSPYQPMVLDPQTMADAKKGMGKYLALTSGDCLDFTHADFPDKINGVTSFSTYLATFGNNPSGTGCAKKVTCNPNAIPTTKQACVAANKFMQLKTELRKNIYFCKTFSGNGAGIGGVTTPCDIKDMLYNSVTKTYTKDCVQSDGKLYEHQYRCTLDEFTAHIQNYDKRIKEVFKRLDTSAADSLAKINVKMKELVERDITYKIRDFANGVTCGFLGNSYQKFIESICYAGVVGFTQVSFSYVACGVLTLILVIIMYIVWRIAVDNYNTNEERPKVVP